MLAKKSGRKRPHSKALRACYLKRLSGAGGGHSFAVEECQNLLGRCYQDVAWSYSEAPKRQVANIGKYIVQSVQFVHYVHSYMGFMDELDGLD